LRAQAAIAFGPALEQADIAEFGDPLDHVPISQETFHLIHLALHHIYVDETVPKLVRRRTLEASVRAPEDWHKHAIAQAYATGDNEWMLTAVFCMRWVSGFHEPILDSLRGPDAEIHCQTILAAGNAELTAAWHHVVPLVENPRTPKRLLLVAIEAVDDDEDGIAWIN
jgi:hypothetical protein